MNLYTRSKYITEESSSLHKDIVCALESRNGNNQINPAAVLSIMQRNYIVGDGTLVKGISRESWCEKISAIGDGLLPEHGRVALDPRSIALNLKRLLVDEIESELIGKSSVGVLLSGGMDSRIVAGVIRELQVEGRFRGSVVGLTWGVESSRDVVYSQRICSHFGWDFRHFKLTPEMLFNNIRVTSELGCEFSPLHLHAMPEIAKLPGLDIIFAGSYGDSIGRAEYSGVRVGNISAVLDIDFDKFNLVSKSVKADFSNENLDEVTRYRMMFPRREEWEFREIERQCHYMRRQLGACMEVIDNTTPVYQAFTSPSVYGYMWSIDPSFRNDEVYSELLLTLPGCLLDIPWARDGKIYPGIGKPVDSFLSSHNEYGKWLRNDCRDFINQKLDSGVLQSLGVFNEHSLRLWRNNWHKSKSFNADRLDERISWMASLVIFCERHSILGVSRETSTLDSVNAYLGLMHGLAYRTAKKYMGS